MVVQIKGDTFRRAGMAETADRYADRVRPDATANVAAFRYSTFISLLKTRILKLMLGVCSAVLQKTKYLVPRKRDAVEPFNTAAKLHKGLSDFSTAAMKLYQHRLKSGHFGGIVPVLESEGAERTAESLRADITALCASLPAPVRPKLGKLSGISKDELLALWKKLDHLVREYHDETSARMNRDEEDEEFEQNVAEEDEAL